MEQRPPRWRMVGASVQGAAHRRRGLPNQDALWWWPESGLGPPLALAVADGHGSAKCFRSHVGSRLAVEGAVAVAALLLADAGAASDVPDPGAIEGVAAALVQRWQGAVQAHLLAHPFSAAELERLAGEGGAGAADAVAGNPLLAYGATLSTVWIGESFLLYLQLGDGDILAVSDTGDVGRPVPGDERLFAGQTTSLCAPEAWRDFRVGFQTLAPGGEGAPALVLLATDGYANAFREDAGFLQVGADLERLVRAQGLEAVVEGLETWLAEASECGSGDDVSVGLLCRLDDVPRSGLAPVPDCSPRPAECGPAAGAGRER